MRESQDNQDLIASAPAKLILCGEHAVVYCRPAIALPVVGVRAYATAQRTAAGTGLQFIAPDLGRSWSSAEAPDEPLSQLAHLTLKQFQHPVPDLTITITSDIPIASGMGSGAAIATVIVRILAAAIGQVLTAAEISALVYQSERSYHGTPSGIDNTVIAYEQPIWFERRSPPGDPQPLHPMIAPITIRTPFALVIGDTGLRSATRLPVGAVRERWQAAPEPYEQLFDQIGTLAGHIRTALTHGNIQQLGQLLNENHILLQHVGVSSPELDRLVGAAQAAGALGAKLSGAGWGGIMIALISAEQAPQVEQALWAAGATRVLHTRILASAIQDY